MNIRLLISLVASIAIHVGFGILIFKWLITGPAEEKRSQELASDQIITDLNDRGSFDQFSDTHEDPADFDVISHTVKPGESFWVIAKKYNVSIEELMDTNGLKPGKVLKSGETLQIFKRPE